jgi:phosphate transport system permease protein
MSNVAAPPIPPAQAGGPAPRRLTDEQLKAPWKLRDRIGLALCWAVGIMFCAITAAIVIYFFVQGVKYLSPDLLWTRPKGGFSQQQSGGLLDPLIGTFILAIFGTLIALPIGVGVAVWLSEFGRPFGLARAVESAVEMVAGAPDIVLALFGTVIFSAPALGFLSRKSVDGVVLGRSFLIASIIMSLIAIPLIVASVREGLQAIPGHVREASYAVGKTKAATIRKILLPSARPSIITGTILGMGRVIGDTAIVVVLLGSTLTIFPAEGIPGLNVLRGQGSTLTTYVFNNSPSGDGNQPEKAFAAAFVLLFVVVLLNGIVEYVNRRWKAPEWRG